ncbi:MAG: ferrochelatase [Flavobacteriaceae bacterium]|nr:ferrochelatase [Flavobacteriaceae bacterium]
MKGVLLVNLGSPDSTSTKDVRSYLNQFLMDKRVIDIPYPLRALLVKGIILNTRPKKSAKAYESIWWEDGSPLIVLSERLTEKVASKTTIPVALAMRYKNPSIEQGMKELVKQGVDEIFVIPLYPQYAMSTTETVVAEVVRVQKKQFPNVKLEYLKPFYNDPEYIKVLANSIKKNLPKSFDKLLFSYHGVPVRHITKKDNKDTKRVKKILFKKETSKEETCYQTHCYETTELVKKELGLEDEQLFLSFQSRLGIDPWLQPYTDKTVKEFPKKGVEKLVVVTPAFVSDCLETLEEIGEEAKEFFLENGGKEFTVVPCLNDDEEWADLLSNWITKWQNS